MVLLSFASGVLPSRCLKLDCRWIIPEALLCEEGSGSSEREIL